MSDASSLKEILIGVLELRKAMKDAHQDLIFDKSFIDSMSNCLKYARCSRISLSLLEVN
jgi:hypothetical protein